MPEYTSEQLLEIVNQDDGLPGNPRVKQIARRIVADLFRTIEDFDIHSEEFWAGVRWFNELGRTGQFGIVNRLWSLWELIGRSFCSPFGIPTRILT
jgi:hypothetical protein